MQGCCSRFRFRPSYLDFFVVGFGCSDASLQEGPDSRRRRFAFACLRPVGSEKKEKSGEWDGAGEEARLFDAGVRAGYS